MYVNDFESLRPRCPIRWQIVGGDAIADKFGHLTHVAKFMFLHRYWRRQIRMQKDCRRTVPSIPRLMYFLKRTQSHQDKAVIRLCGKVLSSSPLLSALSFLVSESILAVMERIIANKSQFWAILNHMSAMWFILIPSVDISWKIGGTPPTSAFDRQASYTLTQIVYILSFCLCLVTEASPSHLSAQWRRLRQSLFPIVTEHRIELHECVQCSLPVRYKGTLPAKTWTQLMRM